jgi:hypothetical protein
MSFRHKPARRRLMQSRRAPSQCEIFRNIGMVWLCGTWWCAKSQNGSTLGISRQDSLKTVEDQKHSRVLEAKAHRSLLKGRSPEWSMQDGPAYETYRDVAWSFYPRLARQLL